MDSNDTLALSISRSDGTIKRWGPDEPDGSDILGDLTFSTSIPGGDKDCTCSLLRRIDVEYSDQNLFDQVRVYGPGNRTAWQGRMVQFPRDHGDSYGIKPAAVGLAAHLKDDPSFREIYVDRDLGRWAGPSVQRQIGLVSASYQPSTAEIVNDLVSPAQKSAVTDAWASPVKPVCEAWYDAGGIPLGSLYYAWTKGGNISSADTNWNWLAVLEPSNATIAPTDSSGNLRAAGPGAGVVTATGTRPFAATQLFYGGSPAGAAGTDYAIFWTCLAVYGKHGLTKQGTEDATTAKGFYVSDMIADIVGRAAPMLSFSTGADGSIEPTSFVVPHAAFLDPVTAEDAIGVLNAYHLYDWGVYDNKFFYRAPDPGRLTWKASLSDGAKLSLEGSTAEQVYNGVYVTYTDPSGAKKTVGPPGALADATDPVLADTSDENPVNAHGIPRRWGKLDLSLTTTQAGAIQLGYVWLQERALASRRGQVTLTGTVTHPTEGKVPVWRVRAGDWISISDHPASAPRKIIETSYSHATRTVTASLDNTVAKTEAILERLGVYSIGRW